MSNRATTDKSKPLVLYSRIGEASVPIVFTFLNEDGTAHPIASYDFEYPLKKKPASTTDVFKLTVGNGLTIIDTNKLQLEITDTQATIREASYFGRLYSSAEDHTWVNVEHLFHDGKFDGLTAQTDTITVIENGTAVTITVTGGGGGSVTLASLGTTLQTAASDTPLDADTFNFYDAVDAILKKVTWANIKATLKTYFDTLYDALGAASTVQGNLTSHVNNTSNPHNTTAVQVGADPSGSAATAQAAAQAYADSLVVGLWDDRGNFNASVNAYPSSGGSGTAGAILKGDIWTVSVAGTLPTAQVVEVGDTVRALIDTPGNTQANWAIAQQNIGYIAENQANKVGTVAASATQYPNNDAVIAYVANEISAIPSATAIQESLDFQNRVDINSGTFEKPSAFVSNYNIVWGSMTPLWMLTANAFKTSKLYAAYPITDKGSLTFSRSTTRTRTNVYGDIQSVAIDVPGLEFISNVPYINPELQRTNLLLRSEELDNASWTKTNITPTANAAIAPDLTTTAESLNITNATNDLYQDVTVSASTSYTLSFFVKRGTATSLNYRVYDNTGAADIVASTNYYSQINSVTWVRVSVVFTTPVGCVSVRCFLSNNSGTGTFFAWGTQLEAGSFITSYIPTTTTTVTRTLSTMGALTTVSHLIGQTQGTLYAQFRTFADSNGKGVLCLSDGSTNNRILLNIAASNNVACVVVTGGVTQANFNSAATLTNVNKVAITYQNNKAALFINGTKVGEDLSVTVPACTRIALDNGAGSQPFYGFMKAAAISDVALSDAQAIILTT